MPFKRFNIWTNILLVIFVSLIIIIAFRAISLNGGFKEVTGTLGGPSVITGLSTFSCHETIDGIACNGNFYPFYRENCSPGTVPVCTNVCELDRLMNNDGRVCPKYCKEYCVPLEIAEKIKH